MNKGNVGSTTIAVKRSILIGLILCSFASAMQFPSFADDDKKGASSTPSGAASASPSAGAASGSGSATTNPTPAAGATTGADTSSSTSSSGTPMQAGVQLIELNLGMLRDVGLDIKNLIKAADSLYDEVTIQPVTVITEPEVVGRGIIVNIPVGTRPIGPPAPPKKARVDQAMSQMQPIVTLLKKDADEFQSGHARLDISDDTRNDLKPYFDTWIKTVNDVSTNMDKLVSITQGPPYDNSSIAQAVGVVHQDAQRLDEVRRKIYKYLQKEGKQKKKKDA